MDDLGTVLGSTGGIVCLGRTREPVGGTHPISVHDPKRRVGKERRMIRIVVDDRERAGGLARAIGRVIGRRPEVARLAVGDVTIGDRFVVERKEAADWGVSLRDGRLARQIGAAQGRARGDPDRGGRVQPANPAGSGPTACPPGDARGQSELANPAAPQPRRGGHGPLNRCFSRTHRRRRVGDRAGLGNEGQAGRLPTGSGPSLGPVAIAED